MLATKTTQIRRWRFGSDGGRWPHRVHARRQSVTSSIHKLNTLANAPLLLVWQSVLCRRKNRSLNERGSTREAEQHHWQHTQCLHDGLRKWGGWMCGGMQGLANGIKHQLVYSDACGL